MKRVYTIFFIMSITLLCVNSSSLSQVKLSMGPVIGLNYNVHSGSFFDKQLTGAGLAVGGQLEMQFNRSVGLLTTFMFYDNRSGSYTRTVSYLDMDVTEDITENISYFSFEPLLKISVQGSGLYFLVGPSLGFNIDATEEYTETFPSGNENKTKATLHDLSTRFELKMGGGCDIPISRNASFTPQLTFGYGLTDVQSDVDWKILTIQASFALKFRLN